MRNVIHIFFVFSFFISTFLVSAQEDYKKFAMGFSFSPDMAYRFLRADSETAQAILKEYDERQSPKAAFTAGFFGQYRVSYHMSFETGLLFSEKGMKEVLVYNYLVTPGPKDPVKLEVNSAILYLDVPLKVNYYFAETEKRFFLTSGFSLNFFLLQQDYVKQTNYDGSSEKNTSTPTYELNKVNPALIVGFGFYLPLNDKFSLHIAPEYRQSLMQIGDSPIRKYLYSVGLNIGLALCK